LEANEAARRTELENALAAKIDPAEVGVDPGSQVPRSFDGAVTGDVDRVIEVALQDVSDGPWGRVRDVFGDFEHSADPAQSAIVGAEARKHFLSKRVRRVEGDPTTS
jgi:hypothetical protein